MKRLLLASILLLTFIFGRQDWTMVANQVQDRTAIVMVQFENATAADAEAPSEALRAQVKRLRTLAWTCPLLLKCSPLSAVVALHFLDLEDQRFAIFEQAAALMLKLEVGPTDELSGDAEVAQSDFKAKAIEYHKLLKEIDAAKQGVPSEIAQALEPLK